jgi:hypothetical protein
MGMGRDARHGAKPTVHDNVTAGNPHEHDPGLRATTEMGRHGRPASKATPTAAGVHDPPFDTVYNHEPVLRGTAVAAAAMPRYARRMVDWVFGLGIFMTLLGQAAVFRVQCENLKGALPYRTPRGAGATGSFLSLHTFFESYYMIVMSVMALLTILFLSGMPIYAMQPHMLRSGDPSVLTHNDTVLEGKNYTGSARAQSPPGQKETVTRVGLGEDETQPDKDDASWVYIETVLVAAAYWTMFLLTVHTVMLVGVNCKRSTMDVTRTTVTDSSLSRHDD